MEQAAVFAFLRWHRLAVISTTHPSGAPEAALIGFALTPQCEIVFDTLARSRKALNLQARPRVALVIGWDDETSVQLEGVARQPEGRDLADAKATYFAVWPDGRDREGWADIAYFLIRPTWMRYCNFLTGPIAAEFDLA